MTAYNNAGVDLKAGNSFSDIMYRAARATWENRSGLGRIITPNDRFTGIRTVDVSQLPT